MKKEKLKTEKEVFFLNEKNYFRALSEMQSFCDTCNRIAEIIQENDLKITPVNAQELIFTPINEMSRVIIENWRKGSENVPVGVEINLKKPDINQIPSLQNNLVHLGAFNAGFIPRDFLIFKNEKFETDEIKLKDFFTLFKTHAINEIAEKVEVFLKSYQQLTEIGKKHNLGNLIDFYGILNFDAYKDEFSFNKSSDVLFRLKGNFENNKKQQKNGTEKRTNQ